MDGSMMIDDCPMTEECAGFDRDRGMCLLHPDDCELSPSDGEGTPGSEVAEASSPEGSRGGASG